MADVMIAIVILTIGILALLSAITGAIFQSRGQEQQLNAKQISTSAMESIMAVKETDTTLLGWDKVRNVGSGDGIFVTGFVDVRVNAGADEVIGTADDTGATVDGYQTPDRHHGCLRPGPTFAGL